MSHIVNRVKCKKDFSCSCNANVCVGYTNEDEVDIHKDRGYTVHTEEESAI